MEVLKKFFVPKYEDTSEYRFLAKSKDVYELEHRLNRIKFKQVKF